MEPITQERWKTFNDKMQWDIITALRGPDIHHSSTIKHFTTGVIRHRMINITCTHGSVNQDLGVVVLPDRTPHYTERVGEDSNPRYPMIAFWSPEHFLQHVREAAEYLGIPVVYCPYEAWEKAMCSSIREAGKIIIDAIEQQAKEAEEAEAKAKARRASMIKKAQAEGDEVSIQFLKSTVYDGARRRFGNKKEALAELKRHVTRLNKRGGLE